MTLKSTLNDIKGDNCTNTAITTSYLSKNFFKENKNVIPKNFYTLNFISILCLKFLFSIINNFTWPVKIILHLNRKINYNIYYSQKKVNSAMTKLWFYRWKY